MYVKCENSIFNMDKMTKIGQFENFLVIFFDDGKSAKFNFSSEEEAVKELECISKFAQASGIAVYRMGMRK